MKTAKLLTTNSQNIASAKGGMVLLPGDNELTPLQEAILADSAWALSLKDKGLLLVEDASEAFLDVPIEDSELVEEEREKDYWAALPGKVRLKKIEECEDIFTLKLWAECTGTSKKAQAAIDQRIEELVGE